MRYFLDISYKGTNFHGWQKQLNAITIQEEIEKSISIILQEKISIMGSGRTDTGVHALHQIAHFDTVNNFENKHFIFKVNSILPKDISVNDVWDVPNNANARFDALSRTYIYKINSFKNPFLQGLSSFYSKEIFDIVLLNNLSTEFMGEKDFESFAKVKSEVNNFMCNITKAEWSYKDDLLVFEITSNRFLRGMVRAIVGTMIDICNKKINANSIPQILASKDRKRAGQSAKPDGLYLAKIEYSKELLKQF